MKNRDKILFGLPLAAGVLVILFASLFLQQRRSFEQAYMHDAQNNIAQEAYLVSLILKPMLDQDRIEEARKFCNDFQKDTLRLSLIRGDGLVEADSSEDPGFLGNHLDRIEVQGALAGTPTTSMRYSESLNQWMIYHALKLPTKQGEYVIRAAVTADQATRILRLAGNHMLLAMLLGGAMVFMLTFYILRRVRRPLQSLQNAVAEIASGNLETRIEIPASGVVRELAGGVSHMAEQLKIQLEEVTSGRNAIEAILNAMSEAVLLFAENGDVVKYNQTGARLFKLKESGAKFNLARSDIPELLSLAHRVFQNGEAFEKEFTLQRSRSAQTLFIKGRIIVQEGKRFLLLTITDLTNLRKLESFRSDFIANVSHELKTPLTCIIGATETIREESNLTPEQKSKLLEMLFEQSNRLNLLVQDILSLAALEKKQLALERDFAPLSLPAMLTEALQLCADKAAERGISLKISEQASLQVAGDCQLLEQAVANLINNAILYSNSPEIDVSLIREQDFAVITVRDYGIG
ncbi:MAG: histidine kinase dimerization/phospho-acceptor domain-containing protein, partial [Lentisphaeria bacterium]|nr:histidine kinase dimerization/phospho-acceptor domain-containing protein [Lentisphaeria bacterium]